jgi:amylosucrase
MDWNKAQERQDWSTICSRIYRGIQQLVETRKVTPALHAQAGTFPVWTDNEHVFGLLRASPRGRVLVLANFSREPQSVPRSRLNELGFSGELIDLLRDRSVEDWALLPLGSYDAVWLSRPRRSERGRHAYYD